MSILRASLSLALGACMAWPTISLAASPPPSPSPPDEQPPDPGTVSPEERIVWAKKLFKAATEAHERGDFSRSIVKFEQAYSFAPDRHIFAYNIGQDAWELRDCARVKQYLQHFLTNETQKKDLRERAQEILARAENNPECVTGASAPTPTVTPTTTPPRAGSDEENPLAQTQQVEAEPTKRRTSGLFLGGVALTVLGVGAIGGGVGTLAAAIGKVNAIEDAMAPGEVITTFPQGYYNDDVARDFHSLKTLNLVTPILLAAGGAMLVSGAVMLAVDRRNKTRDRRLHAGKKLVLTGLGGSPLPGGGAAASLSLRF